MVGRVMAMVACGAVLGGVVGCAERRQPSPQPAAQQQAAPPAAAAPASSPMAKVKEGMTEPQVAAILGVPDDSNAYITGKAFIPFYYGPDQSRFACYYRGKGRVIFAGGNQWGAGRGKVIHVEYDPSEDGIAGTK
jgi:hypothetical protein